MKNCLSAHQICSTVLLQRKKQKKMVNPLCREMIRVETPGNYQIGREAGIMSTANNAFLVPYRAGKDARMVPPTGK